MDKTPVSPTQQGEPKTLNSAGRTSYSLFQEPWWLDIVAPDAWNEATVESNGQVVARLPYVVRKKYGLTLISRPPLTPTLGVWHRPLGGKPAKQLGKEKDNIQTLLSQLPSHHRCAISFDPAIRNVLPFHWEGFDLAVKYTYRLTDLSNLDAIWDGMESRTRGAIRKAAKTISIEDDLSVDSFFDVFTKTFERQGRKPPVSRAFLAAFDRKLSGRNCHRKLFAVDDQGRVHATVFLVWDDRCLYYLMGGGDPELRNSGASPLLLWHAIQHAGKVSRMFDFEGSMLEPVESFFASFGATQTPYYQVSRTSSRMLRTAASLLGKAA